MRWKEFRRNETVYTLEHLHPFTFDVIVPAKADKPERSYQLNVEFSLHCFTRGAAAAEEIPADLAYQDNRETRIFDFDRYARSKELPDIIRSLDERKCFHDRHGNFYVFEIIEEDGSRRYYSVFFKLSNAGKKIGLNLFISSAHDRDEPPYRKNPKPIRFHVLVHNIWAGKVIRPAP